MSERILIPLDGSKVGETALHYVEEMVSKLVPEQTVEVILLQVLSPPAHRVKIAWEIIDVPYTKEEIVLANQKAMDYLNKAGEGLRSKGVTVECVVKTAKRGIDSAEKIIKAEGEVNANLVAMSTHGRGGLSRWAFGNVTDKVLRGGKVPVLVVRAKRRKKVEL